MRLIDPSRELYHRTPTHPSHPPVVLTDWNTHAEIKEDGGVTFTSRSMMMSMGDHAGTHVDAPSHFDARPGALTVDQVPLENFYTEAVCLERFGRPQKFAQAVDASITKLATFVKNAERIPALLFGEA